MSTQTRDPQFATMINELADAIRWPDPAFTVTPWGVAVGVFAAFYEAFATPERALLQQALRGIAF